MREPKRFVFTPILGWSSSRYDLFSICKRKYFYHYYAKYDRELPSREIKRYKELVTIPLETGSIVHRVIEVLLNRLRRTSEEVDRRKFFDYARREAGHRLQTSKFDEVAYGVLPAVEVSDVEPKVRQCLENLLSSERFTQLMTYAVDGSEEWIIDPPGYGETRIGNLKVYFKVDFLFPVGDRYHIIDWKTGKPDPDKHRKQLIGYSSWASYHFDTEPDNVRPAIAYLHPDYKEVEEVFNSYDLEHFSIQVRAETEEMYEYCRDVDQNIPLDKADFPMVDNERICAFCNFRGICYPDKYTADV